MEKETAYGIESFRIFERGLASDFVTRAQNLNGGVQMQSEKKVENIMIGVFDFPHIPYWFSIGQTIKIIKVAFLGNKKLPEPMVMLVFDEKYSLMGTVTLRDILQGLEPKFLKPSKRVQVPEEDQSALSLIWDTLFDQEAKALAETQVSEIMSPARLFVEPADSIAKAAYMMIGHNLVLLPVLENKKKLVGFVRMIEVFDEISNILMKE
jgi:predicted transcriptional regulator